MNRRHHEPGDPAQPELWTSEPEDAPPRVEVRPEGQPAPDAGESADSDAESPEIRNRADLLRIFGTRPELATPSLVRRLKARVEELYRTDARAAQELAECVFLLAERCGDLDSLALGHRARGLGAMASGSRKDALAHYEAAERLYRVRGDEVERARVLRSMIDALMNLGRYDEAFSAGRDAREIFERHNLPVLAAQVDANVGTLLLLRSQFGESLEAFDRALRVFRAAGEHEGVAMMEYNRANVFSNLNELSEAQRGYRRALRYYRGAGLRLREAQCLYSLAYLAYLRSRYSEALRHFERVRELDVELGDLRHAAMCNLQESEILLSLNAWSEAASLGKKAQTALEELGMRREAAKAVLFHGLAAVHLGRFDDAASLLMDAAGRFESEGNEVWRGLADLYRAELALRRGDALGSFVVLKDVARLFAREGLRTKEAYARVAAARALASMGRRTWARRQCVLALRTLRRAPSASIAYQAHHLLGRLAPSLRQAREHLDQALWLVERLRAHVLPDELRASFQRDKVAIYEDYARLLLSDPAGPRIDEAFGTVEMRKSRVLGDLLAGLPFAGEERPVGRADVVTNEWRHRLEELNGCYRRLNEAELDGRSRSEGDRLRVEIVEREAQLAELFRTLQLRRKARPARQPAETGSRDDSAAGEGRGLKSASQVDPLVVRRVQALLEHDEALVEFFLLGETVHAFVVTSGSVKWVPDVTATSRVREAMERWRFLVEKRLLGREYLRVHRETLRQVAMFTLEELAELVWAPVAQELRDVRKLVIVPAGPLFYVPFHALRWNGRFLVEDLEISQCASARAFAAAHRRPRGSRGAPLVLGIERPALPAIEDEVAAVRRHLPDARVFTGERARRGALRKFGNGARIVHIASHAEFRTDNPLLSAIELADGRLTFYDLFDMRLGSDLVVLSGCQTGHQAVLDGDELMGLSRGFLYAGTASLLASLWAVDDAVTTRFMDRFYSRLKEADGPRAALRCAMREAIGEDEEVWEWAPFYLSGRPRS